jgi:hypothetical protein
MVNQIIRSENEWWIRRIKRRTKAEKRGRVLAWATDPKVGRRVIDWQITGERGWKGIVKGSRDGKRKSGDKGEQGHQESNLDPPSGDGGVQTPPDGHHLDALFYFRDYLSYDLYIHRQGKSLHQIKNNTLGSAYRGHIKQSIVY